MRCKFMIYNCFKFATAAVAVMMASSTVNAQQTFMVTNLDNNGAGSLREAITSANGNDNGDQDAFDSDTGVIDSIEFTVEGTILLTSPLPNISEALNIDGGGGITIDAGNGNDGDFGTGDGFRLFDIDDRSSFSDILPVTLIGLTLTGGDLENNSGQLTGQSGGAIRNREELTLINVHIIENSCGDGGTAFSEGGNGGGIFNLGAPLTLIDCSVTGNRAGDGGTANPPMTGDAEGGEGGAIISTFPGICTLIRTTVSGNTAGAGGTGPNGPEIGGRGGAISTSSVLVIMDSTISGNTTQDLSQAPVTQGGGAIFSQGGSTLAGVYIFGSTVFGNSAPEGSGGAILTADGQLTITNSIIAGNTAGLGDSDISGVASPVVRFSLIEQADLNVSGEGLIQGVSPNLGPLADNGGPTQTHALLAGSPAIGAGGTVSREDLLTLATNSAVAEFVLAVGDPGVTDQRGDARVGDGQLDLGAVEFSADDPNFVLGDANGDGMVSFLDIGPFVDVLLAMGFQDESDINRDGVVSFLDIGPFVELLLN